MRPNWLIVCAGCVLAAGIALDAQWIKLPTPGLPRLPDGKPNLTAPAPRAPDGKPDFSGLWSNDGGDRYNNDVTADGKGKEILIALSPARFSWSGSIVEFSTGTDGAMNMVIQYVEGEAHGPRRK